MSTNKELSGAEKLQAVQQELKAPKNQHNKFGGYNYRSCEDILEAVKPLLKKYKLGLIIRDGVEEVGGRVFVKADVTLADHDGKDIAFGQAYAQHEAQRKGMDGSQITGACSSYARKFALSGLFLLDDVKDADATNKHEEKKPANRTPVKKVSDKVTDAQLKMIFAKAGDKGMPNEAAKELIYAVAGVESSKDILKTDFDAVVEAIDNWENEEDNLPL